jgi:23S rRNA (guanine2445-N2)-methyltransferase / 23S rRNA (guanine2069-N7)-methyltransferase
VDPHRSERGQTLVATCALGTEPALIGELRALGMRGVTGTRGAVRFAGAIDDGMRACLHLRTAMKVLLPLAAFPAPDADALYAGTRTIPWEEHLGTRRTFAVTATGSSATLRHRGFTALKVKDAICDVMRDKTGARPDVDARAPDVPVLVHLGKDEATAYLDLAGQSLHMRGYRPRGSDAPLRETLAAALLLLLGYDGTRPFWDPMAGMGTLVVEAAWIAQRRAPGLGRHFAFERWPSFPGAMQSRWHRMLHEAREAVRTDLPPLRAGDFANKALRLLEPTLKLAGVAEHVRVDREDVRRARPHDDAAGGLVLCNPPYGERMGKPLQIQGLYRGMGEAMNGWDGQRIAVFTGMPTFARHFGHVPRRTWPLFNGPLPCVLHDFGTPPLPRAAAR